MSRPIALLWFKGEYLAIWGKVEMYRNTSIQYPSVESWFHCFRDTLSQAYGTRAHYVNFTVITLVSYQTPPADLSQLTKFDLTESIEVGTQSLKYTYSGHFYSIPLFDFQLFYLLPFLPFLFEDFVFIMRHGFCPYSKLFACLTLKPPETPIIAHSALLVNACKPLTI